MNGFRNLSAAYPARPNTYISHGDPPIRMELSVARFRLLHASPVMPIVDIYASGKRIAANLGYKGVISYQHVPSGQYIIEVYPAGDRRQPLLSQCLNALEGQSYTIAVGGGTGNLKLYAYPDDPAPAAMKAKIKFIHLSPDAPAFDIESTDRGSLYSNVPFGQFTAYATFSPDSFGLRMRAAGTDRSMLFLPALVTGPYTVSTIVAVGCLDVQPALEALFLSDL